jgi:proline dehydrogenase
MLPEFDNTEIAFKYKSTGDLRQAQFLFASMGSPVLTKVGLGLTKWSINAGLPIKGLIKATIFKQFCGGESMEEAAGTAALLERYNIGVIMDYGVEGKEEAQEFDKAVPEFIKAIKYAASKKNIPFISLKITGFARFGLMEKVHSGTLLAGEEKAEWNRVYERINQICAAAYREKVMVLIDAEETWIQNAVNELVDPLMEQYNKEEAIIFNTFQLYCHGTLVYLKESIATAESKGYVLGAKLVRGAYMEKERARAQAMGYPSPIQPDKESTDRDYDEAVVYCLARLDRLAVFIGTHNEMSCLIAAKYMDDHNIPHSHRRIWFSQLFGMSDNITYNMAYQGYNVAKYLPYGPVKDVIPYLMRRAQENTSVAGQTGRELGLINKELKRRRAAR